GPGRPRFQDDFANPEAICCNRKSPNRWRGSQPVESIGAVARTTTIFFTQFWGSVDSSITKQKRKGAFVFRKRPPFDGDKPNSVRSRRRGTAMIIYLDPLAWAARSRRSGTVMRRYPRVNGAGCPASVLSCTAWGFSCLADYSASGELLPRLFTLA